MRLSTDGMIQRRIADRCRRSCGRQVIARLVHLAVSIVGCGDDTVGGSGGVTASTTGELTTSTTTATTTTTADSGSADSTTGFVPDGEACEAPLCTTVADCCVGVPASVACPDTYPNNWSCAGGVCVLGQCTGDGQCSDLFTGWSCTKVDGKKRCVAGCTDDSDCTDDRNMPGTVCVASVDVGRGYCVQPT